MQGRVGSRQKLLENVQIPHVCLKGNWFGWLCPTLVNKNNLQLFTFCLQGSMGSIACIAWKGDTLVLGDVDGNLNFWDLKARLSR